MITITIYQNSDIYVGFESKGHAGYGEEGYDIICAAVSALTINTINSIETFTEDVFTVRQNEGYVKFVLKNPVTNTAVLFLKSMILGLKMIQENYGNKYIDLVYKEV